MSTAITYSRYGSPDVLTVTSADVPQPGPGWGMSAEVTARTSGAP